MNYFQKFRIHFNQSLKQLNKCSISFSNQFSMTGILPMVIVQKKDFLFLDKNNFLIFSDVCKKDKNCSVVSGENGLNQTKL